MDIIYNAYIDHDYWMGCQIMRTCGEMDEKNYRGIDLNLLLVFAVLMRERSTTSAARCLCISQSAVSQSLRRLRSITNDHLFLRDRRGVTPTPRAESLYRDILPSLDGIEAALRSPDSFLPKSSVRNFKLRLMGVHTATFVPDFIKEVQRAAPRVSVGVAVGGENGMIADFLESGEFDAVIAFDASGSTLPSWCRQLRLFEQTIACIYDGERMHIGSPIKLEDYIELTHIIPFLSHEKRSMIDSGFHKLGKVRKRLITTDDYSGIPFYLKKARALANFPVDVAAIYARTFDLSISPLPIPTSPYYCDIYWHGRYDGDPAHMWLRNIILEVCRSGGDLGSRAKASSDSRSSLSSA